MSAWVYWVVFGLACLAIEAVTLGFVFAYFGVGALAAAAAAGLGAPVLGQVAVFAITSFALLLCTRRLFMDWFKGRDDPNPPTLPTLVGAAGVVTIEISNAAATGQVRVGTEYWTARVAREDGSEDTVVPVGANVVVADVSGVTAFVRPRQVVPPPPG